VLLSVPAFTWQTHGTTRIIRKLRHCWPGLPMPSRATLNKHHQRHRTRLDRRRHSILFAHATARNRRPVEGMTQIAGRLEPATGGQKLKQRHRPWLCRRSLRTRLTRPCSFLHARHFVVRNRTPTALRAYRLWSSTLSRGATWRLWRNDPTPDAPMLKAAVLPPRSVRRRGSSRSGPSRVIDHLRSNARWGNFCSSVEFLT
jgi:hypothetical protein